MDRGSASERESVVDERWSERLGEGMGKNMEFYLFWLNMKLLFLYFNYNL